MPLPTADTEYTLRIRGLSKTYKTGKAVLHDINLDIVGDGITAIIGPSGSGKSTLIRCINGLVEPTVGDVLFQGQNLAHLRGAELRAVRRHIGMVFQEHNLVERLTVVENVLTGRLGYTSTLDAWLRRFPEQDLQEAYTLIAAVGLTEHAHQRADRLSGGQRQRVGIARAIMQRPNLLLADEPTSALDPKTSVEIMELMSQLIGARNIPVIVNMHNVELARRFSKRIIGLIAGRVVFDGEPSQLRDDHLKQIYGGEDWLV
ncbi:MAG: phosphonate ABC transporter ATP-binding protein [Betaproteobacteria bacterium]|nr:phosphonate ABC transporter ATP-binding protein [Betaproteobacteria bacterium]